MSAHYMIGQRVGDYLIQSVLGEGGMGVVFRAVHERLGQVVAIKMLHPGLVAEERLKSRFVREAQALARLNHPNVIRLLNFVNREDSLFIVMEFMEGRCLDNILNDRGRITEIEAAEIYQQVLAAMHYAHSLGIIHRDIKPSNLAIMDNGGVKVLDFGTAKILGEQKLTQEGMTLGTLIYMSPEQICGRELDHRSDIYSLGVTLYEMVTGNLPHYCEDEMELVREIARGVPDPPSKHHPGIAPDFERIVLRAIEKDPARRYQTADEFLKDLNGFLAAHKGGGARRATPPGEHAGGQPPGPGVDTGGAAAPKPPSAAPAAARPNLALLGASLVILLGSAGGGIAIILSGQGIGSGSVLMGVGLAAALMLGVLGFRGGNGRGAPGRAPAPVVGEATIALDEGPPKGGGSGAPPPPLPPPGGALPAGTERDLPPFPAQAQQSGPAGYLYAVSGPDQGRNWPLPYGAVTIGRGAHNTIVLADGGISTTHAQIGFDGTQFVLTDLQSRNGCYVNHHRVTVAPLKDRDVIHLGTSEFSFSPAPAQRL